MPSSSNRKTTVMPVEKESDEMIAGLQIKIRGEELSRRMAERIRAREEAIAAIDRRIERRAGEPADDYKSVADLELSVRSRKALQRLNINSVGELASRTEDELLGCKNFGHTSLNEIKQILATFGVSLRKLDHD